MHEDLVRISAAVVSSAASYLRSLLARSSLTFLRLCSSVVVKPSSFHHVPFQWSPPPSFRVVHTRMLPTMRFMLRQRSMRYGSLFLPMCVAMRSCCTQDAIALIGLFLCRSCIVFSQVA